MAGLTRLAGLARLLALGRLGGDRLTLEANVDNPKHGNQGRNNQTPLNQANQFHGGCW
ncbi:MAG TPA: hypothetical protein V6C88_09000 [Chroococcidiopsis sp.]